MSQIKLEIKDGETILSTRNVEIKGLSLSERCVFNDTLQEIAMYPREKTFTKVVKLVRLCTDLSDEVLGEWSDAEFWQLYHILTTEYGKKK